MKQPATSAVWHEPWSGGTPARSLTGLMLSRSWTSTGKPASRMCSTQRPQQPQLGFLLTTTSGSAASAGVASATDAGALATRGIGAFVGQHGKASGREGVSQSGWISVVDVAIKKKKTRATE